MKNIDCSDKVMTSVLKTCKKMYVILRPKYDPLCYLLGFIILFLYSLPIIELYVP